MHCNMQGAAVAYTVSLAKLRKPLAALLLIDVLLARMSDDYFARPGHLVTLGSCLQAYQLLSPLAAHTNICIMPHKLSSALLSCVEQVGVQLNLGCGFLKCATQLQCF